MKFISFTAIILVSIILLSSCEQKTPAKRSFNSQWKFKILEKQVTETSFHMVDFDDNNWANVSLPHTANIEPLIVNNQWQGNCWYRKQFEIPKSNIGKKLILEFEAAMNHSQFWLNGEKIAEHQGGYLPVVIDISERVKAGTNTIAVRLNNEDNPVTGPKPLKILDFNMYGGLYRNAWLIVKEKVHISHPILADKVAGGGIFITTPVAEEQSSQVKVKSHVMNDNKSNRKIVVVNTIYSNGKPITSQESPSTEIKAGADYEFIQIFNLKDAKLWAPAHPNLYTLKTEVMVDGKTVDTEENRFGIREFKFRGNDLYINGEKTYLRGTNRHQEYPFVGYALSANAQYRDAKKIKDAGFDYIRLSHYPHSKAFMNACDELGLVTIDAILGWQFYNDTEEFRNYCYKSAKNLIKRDRNHPSVLAWEVSLNETQMPIPFMEELHRITHAEYPGENVYSCGWKPVVYDIFFQARQHRIMHHFDSIQPKPYMVSEYGDWEYYSTNPGLNQHMFSKELRYEKSSRQARAYGEVRLLQQAHNLQEAYNDNLTTPAYGDGYWVMYDYNRGYHNELEYSGIMDIFRLPKFAYYFYQSQRSIKQDTILKIASYWTEKSPLNVTVYSNCDEVELLLNENSIAKQKPDQNKNTTKLNNPPFTFHLDKFEVGQLKAIGYLNGVKIKEDVVISPDKPTKLKAWIDESGKAPQAGCNDVVFLYLAACDKNGTIDPFFTDKIEVNFDGNIEIMNIDRIKAEAGIATVLMRIGKQSGTVKVSAKSNNLKLNDFTFMVQK